MPTITFRDGSKKEAEFRTDHASSSYGMPVLVTTDDGIGYAPGDLVGCTIDGEIPDHPLWKMFIS